MGIWTAMGELWGLHYKKNILSTLC